MKTVRTLIILLIVLSLPIIARIAFHYRGLYSPTPVARPAIADLNIPAPPQVVEFVDAFETTEAVIVFDMAHDNHFKEEELTVLLGRLAARGAQPEYLVLGDSLARKLRRAQGFVIISPRTTFTNDEIREIQHFVQTGGKLLLITDPTRFEVVYNPLGMPSDRKSDVAVMNMLSASFGLVFEDDFIYNMTHNSGTFRDVILTEFADTPLTRGLKEIVFFAAHSISTSGKPIITTDQDTLSSLTEKQGGLVVAALTAGDHILGISDLTFLTEPYRSFGNNDQLISNIAEFLVSGRRDYTLADFPYFFGERVDLRYSGRQAIGGDVLSQAGLMQSSFDAVGKKLLPRKSETIDNDVLFIGLYNGTDYIQDILSARQISITLETASGDVAAGEATPTATSAAATTVSSDYAEPTETEPTTNTLDSLQGKQEESIKGKIAVSDLGEFAADSVTLLSVGEQDGYKAMVVLAASESALAQALDILSTGDLSQCLTGAQSALCPSTPSVSADLTDTLEDFYLPPPDSSIPLTSTLDFIEPIEPPLLPN